MFEGSWENDRYSVVSPDQKGPRDALIHWEQQQSLPLYRLHSFAFRSSRFISFSTNNLYRKYGISSYFLLHISPNFFWFVSSKEALVWQERTRSVPHRSRGRWRFWFECRCYSQRSRIWCDFGGSSGLPWVSNWWKYESTMSDYTPTSIVLDPIHRNWFTREPSFSFIIGFPIFLSFFGCNSGMNDLFPVALAPHIAPLHGWYRTVFRSPFRCWFFFFLSLPLQSIPFTNVQSSLEAESKVTQVLSSGRLPIWEPNLYMDRRRC